MSQKHLRSPITPVPLAADVRGARAERAHTRVGIEAFVRVRDADREYAFRTRDVSEGGVFLCTRVGHLYPFAVADLLALELHHESLIVVLRGVIVRVVRPDSGYAPGFGVSIEVEPDQRAALRVLMKSGQEGRPGQDPPA